MEAYVRGALGGGSLAGRALAARDARRRRVLAWTATVRRHCQAEGLDEFFARIRRAFLLITERISAEGNTHRPRFGRLQLTRPYNIRIEIYFITDVIEYV